MKKVAMKDFGKDHWSLLAYIETLLVDSVHRGVGVIDKRRVRSNEKTHPMHAVNANLSSAIRWKPEYGTRLSGFWIDGERTDPKRQLSDHDDWDCLNDLESAGLLEVLSEANGFVRLTDKGLTVAGLLRAWKAKGGVFSTFSYTEPETVKS